jgi:hypothetical protein
VEPWPYHPDVPVRRAFFKICKRYVDHFFWNPTAWMREATLSSRSWKTALEKGREFCDLEKIHAGRTFIGDDTRLCRDKKRRLTF